MPAQFRNENLIFLRTLDPGSLNQPHGTFGTVWTLSCAPNVLLKTARENRTSESHAVAEKRFASLDIGVGTQGLSRGARFLATRKGRCQSNGCVIEGSIVRAQGQYGILMEKGYPLMALQTANFGYMFKMFDEDSRHSSNPWKANLQKRCLNYAQWTIDQLRLLCRRLCANDIFHSDLKQNNLVVSRRLLQIVCIDYGGIINLQRDDGDTGAVWWVEQYENFPKEYGKCTYMRELTPGSTTMVDVLGIGIGRIQRHIVQQMAVHEIGSLPSPRALTREFILGVVDSDLLLEELEDDINYNEEMRDVFLWEPQRPVFEDDIHHSSVPTDRDEIQFFSTLDVDCSFDALERFCLAKKFRDGRCESDAKKLERYVNYAGKSKLTLQLAMVLVGDACKRIIKTQDDISQYIKLHQNLQNIGGTDVAGLWRKQSLNRLHCFCRRYFLKSVNRNLEQGAYLKHIRAINPGDDFRVRCAISQLVSYNIMFVVLREIVTSFHNTTRDKREHTILDQLRKAEQTVFFQSGRWKAIGLPRGTIEITSTEWYHFANRVMVSDFGTSGVESIGLRRMPALDSPQPIVSPFDIPWTACLGCRAALTSRIHLMVNTLVRELNVGHDGSEQLRCFTGTLDSFTRVMRGTGFFEYGFTRDFARALFWILFRGPATADDAPWVQPTNQEEDRDIWDLVGLVSEHSAGGEI